jgi:hypothetical protein
MEGAASSAPLLADTPLGAIRLLPTRLPLCKGADADAGCVLPLLAPIFNLTGASLPVIGLVLGAVSMVAALAGTRSWSRFGRSPSR